MFGDWKMNENAVEAVVDAIRIAENRTYCHFDFDTIVDVLLYSVQKLKIIGKGTDYLPLLFENELRNHAMREEINAISVAAQFI